jgi:hypothetical protein
MHAEDSEKPMSMKLATAAVVMTIVFTHAAVLRAAEADENLLATLRPGHPRLFVTPDSVQKLRDAVKKPGLAQDYFRSIEKAAIQQLDAKPAERVLTGPRLLFVSRAVLKRLQTLGVAYLITGERRYADRAIVEMRAVAAFSDWNPSHFLDVAEMSAAMGIGYDWFYDAMSDDDRTVICGAIVKHGMNAGLDGYRAKAAWSTRRNNWAQVCHGGLTVGALAIADDQPQVARDVIVHARDALKTRMNFWAPDGGFVEGPGYWNYATMFAVYYMAALDTALGTDFGFATTEGFPEAGLFRIQTIGPSGLTFNYADAGDHAGRAPQMFWMARRFDRPEYAAHERRLVGGAPDPFDLIWLDTTADATTRPALPRSAFFRGVNVATFRSSWDDASAVYVAVKGGDNKASHAHLDLGSFVLDVGKRRWVCDPGPDDYNLPAYFGKLRWTYYHLNTEGQNTLMLDGESQALDAKAPIVAFADKSDGQLAVTDLSAAYAPKAKRVRRGVRLSADGTVTVQDEIEAAEEPVEIAWGMHTNAAVELQDEGSSAVLTQGDDRMFVTVGAAPAGAKFEVMPVAPPPPQRSHKGMSKLILRTAGKVSEARIVIHFTREPLNSAVPITPLDEWIDFAKRTP